MRLWRISRYPSLDGQGGRLASNRWHDAPRSIVYCADHPSTALIEVLVHLEVDFDDLPKDYKLLEIEVPDISSVKVVSEADLNQDWQISIKIGKIVKIYHDSLVMHGSMKIVTYDYQLEVPFCRTPRFIF